MKKFLISVLALSVIVGCKNIIDEPAIEQPLETEEMEMKTAYIGTYTKKEDHVDGQADGIYTIYLDEKTGKLEFGQTVAEVTNPSFVKTSADKQNLYAVSELGPNDGPAGLVHSFRINEDNSLTALSEISTEAYAPCYIAEDPSGKFVFVANYVGGVVMMYKKAENGSLEKTQKITLENPEASHPHSVVISSDNKAAYIADLGQDRIWIFNFDEPQEELIPNAQPYIAIEKGAGPRHLAFSIDERFLYSINELNSTVSIFEIKNNEGLEEVQTLSSLPENYAEDNSAADIHLHPSGKFLYVSNRGHNSIASFEVDQESGKLKSTGYTSTKGEAPRNFAIAPKGDLIYVANQNTNNIVGLKINSQSGVPEPLGHELEVKTPVCIDFIQ